MTESSIRMSADKTSHVPYLGEQRYGDIVFTRRDTRYGGYVERGVVEVTVAPPKFLGTSLGRVPINLLLTLVGAHRRDLPHQRQRRFLYYNYLDDPAPLL
ncbi:MAG: hypothetical protein AVDCRST_MAG93-5216 [uncultured Chloroflexia bacterium]|uniref:Uncharacterized protein n=1 Tax=uncultured Chloroflexia bacterium TaxID=1672391 RepID=A0A6J4KPJ2_9CHLR|nr:MAG: hypothetical protein AVDCRST_MAG93-5216 [uncultured Chloroflexia bacterium]